MQSTYEKGCDEITDGSGATDICAHCASEDKLQPGLYYCFQCGSFGRYMCGDCNIKHRKYAHEVQSISDAAQQKEQNIYSFERGCDASQDDSGATDICAHCASDSNIQPAFYFCFHCGPFGRYMCENCNKQHKKFANAHEVRKLSKEAPQKREIRMIQPTPRQRPLPAVRTKTKVDTPQLVTKPVETGKIKFSGRTDNAVDKQATTPSKTENVMSSYSVKELNSVKELTTMFELQMKQGTSPNKQRNISNITETRKLDSNVEQVEQHTMKMKIQAAEKETDFVNRREMTMIQPTPRQRPVPAVRTKTKVEMPQLVTKSVETGKIIEFTEKVRSSNNGNELNTLPVLQRDQGNSLNEHKKTSNMQAIRKLDSNLEKIEQQVVEMQIHAAEKNRHWNELSDSYFIVAAIDIGSTNSGYAYSIVNPFKKDPTCTVRIYTHNWMDGNSVSLNYKTPTCVLFDKNKKFYSFGFDAENNYRELACDGEHRDYYFFRRFKRTLFDKMQPKRKLMLEDETGKSMDAMDVFSACIKYLRERLMDTFLKTLPDVCDNDIRWVLTLPGICNEASKEFMRESAQKAGIHRERLLIATEPEAAIMFARNLPVKSSTVPGGRFKPFAAKSKCLVFDAGYAIKITIHEVQDNRAVRELYETSDVKLGSTNVDQAFRDFLAAIVGNDIMNDFEHYNMMDYIDLFRDFDIKKRNVENDMKEKITLKVPITLCETFENAKGIRINDHIETKPEYNGKVYWSQDKVRIESDIAKGLFKETFDKVARRLKSLFSKPEVKDVQNVLMVGAFSESPLLQDVIIKTFPNKRIIIPEDASMSVLKGAVILGHVW